VLNEANTIKPKKGGSVSVSIPAISSGIFGFPLKKCAEIMIETTIKWSIDNKRSNVSVVRLTNLDVRSSKVFESVLDEFMRG